MVPPSSFLLNAPQQHCRHANLDEVATVRACTSYCMGLPGMTPPRIPHWCLVTATEGWWRDVCVCARMRAMPLTRETLIKR